MNGTKLVAIISDAASTGKFPLHLGSFQGSYRVLNSWNLPSNFPDLKKVFKIEVKSRKLVASLKFFFFSKLQQVLHKWIFFPVAKSYSISPVLKTFNHRMRTFVYGTFAVHHEKAWSLLNTYLFSLCLEKYIVLEKVWKKSRILDPKICTNPVC